MANPRKPLFYMLFFSAVILLLILIMQPLQVLHFKKNIDILFPQGIIGWEELDLLLILQVMMLFVIVPVYILTFVFSWRYRYDNPKGKYDPDLVDHKAAEFIWWGLPLVMTLAAGIFTWVKTHELDPYKPISSDKKPLTIQVVALQWKWLFIYPEDKIASLNFLQIPEKTPINFEITADAPMNSFWIPKLGGQIYAMPKMKAQLHLIADSTGDFRGSSANISGEGFAAMHFICRSSTEENYKKFIETAKKSENSLDFEKYEELAKPSTDQVKQYQLKDDHLFEQIIMKYTQPKK